MNERIRELAEQAGFTVEDGHIQSLAGKRAEKFAELIIRECAEIALVEDHDPYECILKHFGVE